MRGTQRLHDLLHSAMDHRFDLRLNAYDKWLFIQLLKDYPVSSCARCKAFKAKQAESKDGQ